MTRRWILGAALLLSCTLARAQQPRVNDPINFFDNYVEVRGMGLPPLDAQAKGPDGYALARIAAISDAQRRLVEVVQGVQVDSQTRVENLRVTMDVINSGSSALIRRATTVSESTMADFISADPTRSGRVEVVMRLPLQGSNSVASAAMPSLRPEILKNIDSLGLPAFQPAAATAPPAGNRGAAPAPPANPPAGRGGATPPAVATTTPPPAPAAEYDALIVKVPSSFKPALAPKIMSEKGEIVFSVKDVAADILVSRGAAQYTNNETKAQAVLDNMGAKMILTVSGSLRTDTDAEVSGADATKIYSSNKATALLSKGRVVFLVAAR